jgi:hypothetical protein
MSILRVIGGWGIIFLGTIISLGGHIMASSGKMPLGKSNTVAFGTQLKEIGFIIIIAGFAAWFIVYVLGRLNVIRT